MADGSGLSRKNTITTERIVLCFWLKCAPQSHSTNLCVNTPMVCRAKGELYVTDPTFRYAGDIAFAVFY